MAKSRPQRRQVFWRRGGSTTSEPVRGPPTGRRARTVTQLTGLARTVGARGGHEGPGGHPGPHLCCPVLAYCKPCDEASPPPGAWTLSPLWTHASTSGLGKPRRGFPQASTAFIVFENLLINITTGLLHPTTGSRIRSLLPTANNDGCGRCVKPRSVWFSKSLLDPFLASNGTTASIRPSAKREAATVLVEDHRWPVAGGFNGAGARPGTV